MTTLADQRVRRAGRFLKNTLTKGEMKKFESILAFDQQSKADMLAELGEILGSESLSQSDIERCRDLLATLQSSHAGEDDPLIPSAPTREQDASTNDQPYPVGRGGHSDRATPLRRIAIVHRSRSSTSPRVTVDRNRAAVS